MQHGDSFMCLLWTTMKLYVIKDNDYSFIVFNSLFGFLVFRWLLLKIIHPLSVVIQWKYPETVNQPVLNEHRHPLKNKQTAPSYYSHVIQLINLY